MTDKLNSQQLLPRLRAEFAAATTSNRLDVIGSAIRVLGQLIPLFVGDREECLAVVEKFWDETVVPYDVPFVNETIEKAIEAMMKPQVLALVGVMLDRLGVE